MSSVVNVDLDPALFSEVHLLRRAATDPTLPAETRAAPAGCTQSTTTPPVYGHLMENLAPQRKPLTARALTRRAPRLQPAGEADAARIWSALAPISAFSELNSRCTMSA